jgi:hypothetical protein
MTGGNCWPHSSAISENNCTASAESPPRSKKLSSGPMADCCSRRFQICVRSSVVDSVGVSDTFLYWIRDRLHNLASPFSVFPRYNSRGSEDSTRVGASETFESNALSDMAIKEIAEHYERFLGRKRNESLEGLDRSLWL